MPMNVKCKRCFNYRNEWCKKIMDSPSPELFRDCPHYKPMTNADRIRQMSDEELAFYIFNHPQWVDLDGYLNWLNQEVESDG